MALELFILFVVFPAFVTIVCGLLKPTKFEGWQDPERFGPPVYSRVDRVKHDPY